MNEPAQTAALPPLPKTPDLPISSFLNSPALVPAKCMRGMAGEELRAVSIADCRRYAEAYARAALSAAAPAATPPNAERAEGWRPIETAPKDGSYFLASNEHGVWVAHWFPVATSGYRFDQPWRSVMLNHWHLPKETRYQQPTHWMPLPAAPGAAAPSAPTPPEQPTDTRPRGDEQEAKVRLTMRISYERTGRCFWHLNCKAQRHAPPMKIERDDAAKEETLLRCTACGEAGWYPHGSVGEVCCEPEALVAAPPEQGMGQAGGEKE